MSFTISRADGLFCAFAAKACLFGWNDAAQEALNILTEKLVTAPVLALPDAGRAPTALHSSDLLLTISPG